MQQLTDGLPLPTFLLGQAQLNNGSGWLAVQNINSTLTNILIRRCALLKP